LLWNNIPTKIFGMKTFYSLNYIYKANNLNNYFLVLCGLYYNFNNEIILNVKRLLSIIHDFILRILFWN
jgi:thymidine kinase